MDFLKCNNGLFSSSKSYHLLNNLALIGCVCLFIFIGLQWNPSDSETSFANSWKLYGGFSTLVLYFIQSLPLLALPQALFNFLGFFCFNPFSGSPSIQKQPLLSAVPFICFRVVTRGDYPELVHNNVQRNVNTSQQVGLKNFAVEVVTDKSTSLLPTAWTREVVVPPDYKTQSGAMFKARALQYCLEEGVNLLNDDDWIVHLDEETLLTEGAVSGIVNFICDGRHQFGQGLITYANEEVINYFLTLCDVHRVAEDMGKIQFQLRSLHMPIMGWKGSYCVSQAGAERKVSFDHGPDSSVAEDAYFGLLAASEGYSFNFIQGEMWEKSPFSIMDFLQQRKRWLRGLLLVAHSSKIPFKYRFVLSINVYCWAMIPLTVICSVVLPLFFPITLPLVVEINLRFVSGVLIFMNLFGLYRSFSISRFGVPKFIGLLLAGILVMPIKVVIEVAAVIWALVTPKHTFFVVKKDFVPSQTV